MTSMKEIRWNVEALDGQRAVVTYMTFRNVKIPVNAGYVLSPEPVGSREEIIALRGPDHLKELQRECAINQAKGGT